MVVRHGRNPKPDSPLEWGDQWVWLALDSETKMILSYHIGARSTVNAFEFVRDLSARTIGKYQTAYVKFAVQVVAALLLCAGGLRIASATIQSEEKLQRVETSLPGVCLIRPQVFADQRGFFLESYHRDKFVQMGIRDEFVQDNLSRSVKGTLRGLHYQLKFPQAKVCRVVQGEVLDVAVDIRRDSPHFGQWVSAVLSAADHEQIYIPAGFAHGFLVLSDSADFLYKCSQIYHPEDEQGIAWNDPALKIRWNIENPHLSVKDAAFPPLAKIPLEFLPPYRP